MPMYQRPPFWRVPRSRQDPDERHFIVKRTSSLKSTTVNQSQQYTASFNQHEENFNQRNHAAHHSAQQAANKQAANQYQQGAHHQAAYQQTANLQVTPGTPAGRELVRGDIIAKIDDYDARDLRHEDAQNLFKNAQNQIRIVVQRGGSGSHLYSVPKATGSYVGRVPTPTFYHEYGEDVDRTAPRGAAQAPRSPIPHNVAPPPFRTPSPLPPMAPTPTWSGKGPESLPRTPIPGQGQYPVQHEGYYRNELLSPSSTRTDETYDENINTQPYRTTPLVLPGAKVRREPGPTESYLRHHPNPAMRAPPHHDYRDTLMRQKVVHKQFNSPINLYSEQNIANSIRQQTSPLPHKPTMLYDPAKSETFRLLQEEGLGDVVQEVPQPVETKVFTAPPHKKPAPTPKAKQPDAKPKGKQTTFVNSLNEEHIQQSNSFKRLMYNVLGETEF